MSYYLTDYIPVTKKNMTECNNVVLHVTTGCGKVIKIAINVRE
jgi:hypothetical protein